jgi:hypothetical protein
MPKMLSTQLPVSFWHRNRAVAFGSVAFVRVALRGGGMHAVAHALMLLKEVTAPGGDGGTELAFTRVQA